MSQHPQSWPNLVGKKGDEAVEIIKQETGTNETTV